MNLNPNTTSLKLSLKEPEKLCIKFTRISAKREDLFLNNFGLSPKKHWGAACCGLFCWPSTGIPPESDHKELTVWICYTREVDSKCKNRPQKVKPDFYFFSNTIIWVWWHHQIWKLIYIFTVFSFSLLQYNWYPVYVKCITANPQAISFIVTNTVSH